MFDHIAKHLEVLEIDYSVRLFFNSLVDVRLFDQNLSCLVFCLSSLNYAVSC